MRDRFLSGISYLPLRAADDGGAPGAGTAPGADGAPPAVGADTTAAVPDAATAAAAADGAAAPAATSILDTKDAPAGDGKDPAKPAEGDPNETPEAKAAREKTEGDAKVADTLKSFEALKLPDGTAADDPAFAAFKDAASKAGVSKEAAQALIDAVAPQFREAIDAPMRQWQRTQEEWIAADKADPEFGGGDLVKNMGIARKGVDAVMNDAKDPGASTRMLQVLAFTGAGNNPDVARFLFRVGQLVSEPDALGGKSVVTPPPKNAGQTLYPTMSSDSAG